ncbi:hypothetical protein SteCoe_2274 [Stentor coeruleus]|uniref:DNRLRE domain-containing protein n=1 Tax=Stentor coeruleus TaxID=5963 RepID=A0A1R2CZS8_9CILI|nr:hypothetical protein SteCoe_2274 [Stentor coeruleus]
MNNQTLISLLYKNEVKFILNTALRVLTIQTLFNISSSNIYLQDFSGVNYFPNMQGEFTNIKETMLTIQPASDSMKLGLEIINRTDSRYVYTSGDNGGNNDYLCTGYSIYGGDMRRSLIKFDNLTSLNGKQIVKIFLQIIGKPRISNFYDYPKEVFVNRILQSYGSITKWSQLPYYRPDPDASIMVAETNEVSFNFDITLLVRSWLDGSCQNYGLLLRQDDIYGVESAKLFYSNSKPPQLMAYYLMT